MTFDASNYYEDNVMLSGESINGKLTIDPDFNYYSSFCTTSCTCQSKSNGFVFHLSV